MSAAVLPEPEAVSEPKGPQRILVIDDDWATRETFRHMLLAEGYTVRAAPDVESGLAEAAIETPDAMLLDLRMPVVDGLECVRRIRGAQQWSAVPVAILTGDYFLEEEVAQELRDLGARIHFKPLWEDDLRRIVRELLR
jgi:DNA-binding response OmpR family regulator